MLKVIHLTTVHGRYDVRIFHKQCRSVAACGHDVTLVVQDGKGDENREKVKIVDLGSPFANRMQRVFFAPWRSYLYLRRVPADIIHFHDPELLPLGFFLKGGKRRLIYDSHEDVPRQILSKHWIHPLTRKIVSVIFEVLENYIAARMDTVVCATPFITNRFNKINSLSVNVNNFPIKEEFNSSYQQKKSSRTICYIGVITRERGITEIIEALEILKNVKLIMCGPFESETYADELKSRNGWKYVDYRGIVSRKEVGEIMACCMAGLVTLLPSPNQYHSLPIKLFEYMSAGLAVIASDFPLWRQIVEEWMCGLCVDPTSPHDIAKAINAILENEAMCRQRGNSGREAVITKFNWEKESEKLLNLYEAIR